MRGYISIYGHGVIPLSSKRRMHVQNACTSCMPPRPAAIDIMITSSVNGLFFLLLYIRSLDVDTIFACGSRLIPITNSG